MRNIYLHLKEFNQLIIETVLESNEQILSYKVLDNIIIFNEDVYEEFDYVSLVKLLEDDFSISITLVIGGNEELVVNNIRNIPSGLYYFNDFIIYLVKIDKALNFKSWLFNIDRELLETINTFISLDMSVNKTAKRLYIHRNTLNYRLDKFDKLTDLNIRSFKGCLSVYLLLNFVQSNN